MSDRRNPKDTIGSETQWEQGCRISAYKQNDFISMKRPLSVTILLWLVLSLTAWSILRLVTAIQWWSILLASATPPGPLYIAISGGFWTLVSLVLLWGLLRARDWARIALVGTGAGFSVWYWSDRLLLQSLRENWPFSLGATLVLLIIVMICAAHPRTKAFLT
jgi:hypothetical protein